MVEKVVFSVGAKVKDDEVHPTLKMIGLYLNTLAQNGVPARNRHIAAMFHQGGGDAVFTNEVYKARHNGVENPNIAILKELHEAGVELRVCGQGLLGKKVDPSQLLPGVQDHAGRPQVHGLAQALHELAEAVKDVDPDELRQLPLLREQIAADLRHALNRLTPLVGRPRKEAAYVP